MPSATSAFHRGARRRESRPRTLAIDVGGGAWVGAAAFITDPAGTYIELTEGYDAY